MQALQTNNKEPDLRNNSEENQNDLIALKHSPRIEQSGQDQQDTNKNILITKPDKGSGVVILSKTDYIAEMETILCDSNKFICSSSVEENSNTAKLETKLQRRLLAPKERCSTYTFGMQQHLAHRFTKT